MKGWQYRWFVLDENAGLFSYYTSKEKMRRGVRRGCVRLRGAVVGIDDEDDATFTVTVDNKTFHFQAKDAEEREKWIRALEDTAVRHNQIKRRSLSSYRKAGGVKMEDFDKKLSETDAYLQLLIDQNTVLTKKAEIASEEEKREKYVALSDKVNDMVESVKHAIVLLQIAKNASCPQTEESILVHSSVQKTSQDNISHRMEDAVEDGVEEGSECQENNKEKMINKMSSLGLSTSSNLSPTLLVSPHQGIVGHHSADIPAVSYSSSDDDDDDFFDAQDDFAVGKAVIETAGDSGHGDGGGAQVVSAAPILPPDQQVSPLTPSEMDWDSLYEEEEEESEIDMKSQGSVITHLLSQVRIGMDLTKIVLPTFILERRSLLEMYADFFAHPDIFISITDKNTPEERMIQVLRWYLSSFHASRKSAVAKKPYNPILGEIFRCHWSLPQVADSEPSVPNIPIPWCSQNDIIFLAEQVSHHPPISAFYVECGAKKISFNGHIYTKSSFLGVSVAVHNVGEGRVTLIDRGEDYVVTFPSGYGRSILTTPWLELGGKCEITCPQTGYRADIEFKCKPFWSNEMNKIVAEIFAKDSKKPIVKVEGEWNGRMNGKWSSGKTDTFLDVNNLPVTNKNVKSVAEQEKHESRRLWREVTAGLKTGDIESATEAKAKLEAKQRKEAKERKETGIKWENRMFSPVGENWFFTNSLASRLNKSS